MRGSRHAGGVEPYDTGADQKVTRFCPSITMFGAHHNTYLNTACICGSQACEENQNHTKK